LYAKSKTGCKDKFFLISPAIFKKLSNNVDYHNKLPKMKRLFAAIKIKPEKTFFEVYTHLTTNLSNERINWVNPENIHITLKFFGETDERKIPDINAVFKNIALHTRPFTLSINKVGIFGSSYQPKVVWFGIDTNPVLLELARNVKTDLQTIGFDDDGQHFVPHLTIGRIKLLNDRKFFQEVINEHKNTFIQEVPVNRFFLYESILRREGPIYKVVETFPFSQIQ